MAGYTGKTAHVEVAKDKVYERLADFSGYNEMLEKLPAEAREKIGNVKFTPDAIVIEAAPVGEIRLNVTERIQGERVVMAAENSPVPMHLTIALGESGTGTDVTPTIDVEVPAMLKPFVGPKMQQAADQFGAMLSNLLGIDRE